MVLTNEGDRKSRGSYRGTKSMSHSDVVGQRGGSRSEG